MKNDSPFPTDANNTFIMDKNEGKKEVLIII